MYQTTSGTHSQQERNMHHESNESTGTNAVSPQSNRNSLRSVNWSIIKLITQTEHQSKLYGKIRTGAVMQLVQQGLFSEVLWHS